MKVFHTSKTPFSDGKLTPTARTMNHFKSHTMRQVLSEWFNTLCFPVSLEYHHTQRCVVTIYHLYIVDLSVEKDVYSVYWERETHSTAQVEGLSEWHSEVRGQWLAEVLEAGSRCGMSFVSERVLAHWRGGREGARLVTLKKKTARKQERLKEFECRWLTMRHV